MTATNGNRVRHALVAAVAMAMTAAIGSRATAQESPQIDFDSVGRGSPVAADAREYPVIGATYDRNSGDFVGSGTIGASTPS